MASTLHSASLSNVFTKALRDSLASKQAYYQFTARFMDAASRRGEPFPTRVVDVSIDHNHDTFKEHVRIKFENGRSMGYSVEPGEGPDRTSKYFRAVEALVKILDTAEEGKVPDIDAPYWQVEPGKAGTRLFYTRTSGGYLPERMKRAAALLIMANEDTLHMSDVYIKEIGYWAPYLGMMVIDNGYV